MDFSEKNVYQDKKRLMSTDLVVEMESLISKGPLPRFLCFTIKITHNLNMVKRVDNLHVPDK